MGSEPSTLDAVREDGRIQIEQLHDQLLSMATCSDDPDAWEAVDRTLHTLKAVGTLLGAPVLSNVAHDIEDALLQVRTNGSPPADEQMEAILRDVDMLRFMVEVVGEQAPDLPPAGDGTEAEGIARPTQDEEDAEEDLGETLGDLAQFIPDFVDSARENVEKIAGGLLALEDHPDDHETLHSVFRHAHSLKGAALTMGLDGIGKVAHGMEDVLRELSEKQKGLSNAVYDVLFRALDTINMALDILTEGHLPRVTADDLLSELSALIRMEPEEGKPPAPLPPCSPAEGQRGGGAKGAPEVRDTIRVRTDKLDQLLNLTGELLLHKITLGDRVGQLGQLHTEAQQTVQALLHAQAHAGDGAARDLLGEAVQGVTGLVRALSEVSDRFEEELEYTGHLLDEIQERVMEVRMLPLSTVFNAFPRAVRDLARQCGKDVQLIVEGEHTEMDKGMLQLIGDPLTHLIRNAVDHGVEAPDERIAAGKPAQGTIRLRAEHRGNKVVIQVMDDGRGIDLDALREVALRRHLLDEDSADRLNPSDLLDLVFQPGFSTAKMITDVSGRGVGMDVVQTNVKQLKGTVSVSSETGRGTTITIELPLTLALIRALLVRVAGRTIALPTASVARTLRVAQDRIQSADGREATYIDGQIVPLARLDATLGWAPEVRTPRPDGCWPAVVLGPPERWTAFLVDELLDEQEIVVKSLGSHLKKVPNVSGATILGNGDVVPILDVPDILAGARIGVGTRRSAGRPPRTPRRVLLVEDQVVTQQIEKSLLKASGYSVETVDNGLEALDMLNRMSFDLVVSDIQMPGVDGFELTRMIKEDPRHRTLPVVIVSSMEKEEDKRRGLEVGADAYILKSRFDQSNLLSTIKTLIGEGIS